MTPSASTSPTSAGLTLDRLFPRSGRRWPGWWTAADGSRVYGLLDRARGTVEVVDPAADSRLPALGRLLAAGELVAYRPTRRAVVRLPAEGGGQPRYAKVLRPGRAGALVARYQLLDGARTVAGAGFPASPPVLEWSEEDGVVVLGGVAGDTLHAAVRRRPAGAAMHVAAVARALAAVHDVELPGPAPVAGGARPLERWPARIAPFVDAATLSEYGAALGALPPLPAPPEPSRLVHGDLHDGNVLLAEGGVALVDLDAAGAGHPATDLGNLAAHLVLRALQATGGVDAGRAHVSRLVEEYAGAGGRLAEEVVAGAAARSMYRLSCVCLVRPRWHRFAPGLLAEAIRSNPGGSG